MNIFVLSYMEHKAEQPGQSSQQRKEAQDDADEVGPDAGKAGALCPYFDSRANQKRKHMHLASSENICLPIFDEH